MPAGTHTELSVRLGFDLSDTHTLSGTFCLAKSVWLLRSVCSQPVEVLHLVSVDFPVSFLSVCLEQVAFSLC